MLNVTEDSQKIKNSQGATPQDFLQRFPDRKQRYFIRRKISRSPPHSMHVFRKARSINAASNIFALRAETVQQNSKFLNVIVCVFKPLFDCYTASQLFFSRFKTPGTVLAH